MKGSDFVKRLPNLPTTKRDEMIFDAVRRRDIDPISWDAVVTSCGPYVARFRVSRDALRVGDATDSIRVTVNHETAQHIADEMGAVLVTPKLNDEIWKQAVVRLQPMPHFTWVKDRTMGNTNRMVEQHYLIENKVAAQHAKGKVGLIADVGKDWVNTVRNWFPPPMPTKSCPNVGPIRSANYGWHEAGSTRPAATPAGGTVWQRTGRCHTMAHTDYSQMVRLVQRQVQVWQKPVQPGGPWDMAGTGFLVFDIEDIASDPAMACLVSHEGVIKKLRHPAVLRSCDPAIRCPQVIKSNVWVAPSSCDIKCEKMPPPEPDPSSVPGPDPGPGPNGSGNGAQEPVHVAETSYTPAIIAGLLGLGAAYWWASSRS